MSQEWVNLLIQIPVVAAFIWYSVRLNKDFNAHLVNSEQMWREYLASRDTFWRDTLSLMRTDSTKDMAELTTRVITSDEIVVREMGILRALHIDHDIHVRQILARIAERVGERTLIVNKE